VDGSAFLLENASPLQKIVGAVAAEEGREGGKRGARARASEALSPAAPGPHTSAPLLRTPWESGGGTECAHELAMDDLSRQTAKLRLKGGYEDGTGGKDSGEQGDRGLWGRSPNPWKAVKSWLRALAGKRPYPLTSKPYPGKRP